MFIIFVNVLILFATSFEARATSSRQRMIIRVVNFAKV